MSESTIVAVSTNGTVSPEFAQAHRIMSFPTLGEAHKRRPARRETDSTPTVLSVSVVNATVMPTSGTGISVLHEPRSIASFVADITRLQIADGVALDYPERIELSSDCIAKLTEELRKRGVVATFVEA